MSFMALLPAFGSAISAGGSLLGGMMNQNAQANANNRQMAFSWEEASRDERWRQNAEAFQREQFGQQLRAYEDSKSAYQTSLVHRLEDQAIQKEFAKNGIQWRAQDAAAAGLHPLAAMGAQLASPSSVQVGSIGSIGGVGGIGSGSSISAPNLTAATGLGDALGKMGQNISEGIQNTLTAFERQNALAQQVLMTAKLEKENKLLDAQTARVSQRPTFPSAAGNMIQGQGNSPAKGLVNTAMIKEKPHESVVGISSNRSQEPEGVTDQGFSRTPTGIAPIPSKDVKERIEDMIIPELMWAYRNYVLPNIGLGTPPAHATGYRKWSYLNQEWQKPPVKQWTDDPMDPVSYRRRSYFNNPWR